ncbi:MAG: Uncharacterized protein Athens071426_711 [Parcubacteria group bacterium Athens0714_26]|nr:MAG: Uncharacterized protein Athens071426_711 [Parcubacteria group bacterium Athens0714_26]
MLWLNFLHFYQPANAEFYNIRKALDKSYWRFLVKKGRVELTGSAAYHGFLPLLPAEEVVRQVKVNERILRKYFGVSFKPTGFFLPEMAYTPAVAQIIKRLGYDWIILDEIAYGGNLKHRPVWGSFYIDKDSGLKVIFRNRELSSAYPPDKLKVVLKESVTSKSAALNEPLKVPAEIFVTATDAELYGLRHEDPTAELEKLAKIKGLKTLTLSKQLKAVGRKKLEKINIWPSSWESSPNEVKNKQPFNLWHDKSNKIHSDLWLLINLALGLGDRFKKDKNFYWYRWHLVRGLASCTLWWASARDFSKIFGPYAWSPDDIERGLEDLIRSVRSLNDTKTKKAKLEAEKYYLRIKKRIWKEHWKKHWQKTI